MAECAQLRRQCSLSVVRKKEQGTMLRVHPNRFEIVIVPTLILWRKLPFFSFAQTPAQVVTSWALHRGLITLHTPSSLGSKAASTPTRQAFSAPRGSYASNVELGE